MEYDVQVLFAFYTFIFNSSVQSNYIEPFLTSSTMNIALCCGNFEDPVYDILMPKNSQDIVFSQWDCITIPKIDNSLIVLDEVQPDQVGTLLNHAQSGIQLSLSTNIWLIHSKNQSRQGIEFFAKNELRIGLNAQIFVIKSYPSHDDVYQILGTGTTIVEQNVRENFEYHGDLYYSNYNNILVFRQIG